MFSIAKILLVCALVSLLKLSELDAAVLPASPCTLGWNQSKDASAAGYVLYYGIAGSTTNRQVLGLANTVTLFNLFTSSNYFFYMTAYDAAGLESLPSNFLFYTPQAVSSLKLTSPSKGKMNLQFRAAPGTVCLIEYTPTLYPAQWQILGSATADANGNIAIADPAAGSSPTRYYRAAWFSNPQVLSSLKLTTPVAGTVNVQFHAAPGSVCQVQYSPSLYPQQWQILGNATADTNGIVTITDRPPANAPSRYYRAAINF